VHVAANVVFYIDNFLGNFDQLRMDAGELIDVRAAEDFLHDDSLDFLRRNGNIP